MLSNKQQVRSFSATSTISVQGQVLPVMQMSANYDDVRKVLNFNQSVNDFELYEANKSIVDNDFNEFKEYVISEVS